MERKSALEGGSSEFQAEDTASEKLTQDGKGFSMLGKLGEYECVITSRKIRARL